MIIAIDGPSGSGKTTIAQAVAKRLKVSYFDTGAMYRALTWAILNKGVSLSDEKSLQALLESFSFTIKKQDNQISYFVDSVDVTEEIRTKQINAIVSQVAKLPIVREVLCKQQRAFGAKRMAVFEGRDIGSVVFPQAELKIFLTAKPEIRAKRRLSELQTILPHEAKEFDQNSMTRELLRRDQIDTTREIAPLKKAKDALEIDTSNCSIEKVVQQILTAYEEVRKKMVRRMAPGWLKSPQMPFLYRTVLFFTWIICKLCYRIQVHGLEHYFPGAALIAPNHTSFLDPPIVGISWPEEVHYMARESLFTNRFFGSFIRAVNSHPVRRDSADIGVFKTILELLSQEKKIVLFAEGVRSDGNLSPLKPGISLLFIKSKSAIIPTYIQGAKDIWGRNRKFPKLWGKLICVFGSPILWDTYANMDKKQAQHTVTQQLEEKILALKKWLEAGAVGTPP